jgi:hypothetical protein
VHTGGYRTKQTIACINEVLQPYAFHVSVIGDEWYVSDGKLRMMRFPDGEPLTVAGAATEYAQPASPGATRKVLGSAQRFRPY